MLPEKTEVLIIGGGVIGLASAYFLSKRSFQVTLVEKSSLASEASYGNGGCINPYHCKHILSPQDIHDKMNEYDRLGKSEGDDCEERREFLKWVIRISKRHEETELDNSVRDLTGLANASIELYRSFTENRELLTGFEERGYLEVYSSDSALNEGIKVSSNLKNEGFKRKILDKRELLEFEPSLCESVVGGIFYPENGQVYPPKLAEELSRAAIDRGVKIFTNTEVLDFEIKNNIINNVKTNRGIINADLILIACGPWSGKISKYTGLRLPFQPGKGYALVMNSKKKIFDRAIGFMDKDIGVIQYANGKIRANGLVEFSGFSKNIRNGLMKWIFDESVKMIPSLSSLKIEERWCGLRPYTPDGFPIIGYLDGFKNLIMASGHSRLGVTLAPITGKLISELIADGKSSLPIERFSPSRFNI